VSDRETTPAGTSTALLAMGLLLFLWALRMVLGYHW